MIGLDTNVLVRYLVQDDPDQSAAASAVIEQLTRTSPGYVSLVATVELYWVLRRAYKVNPADCVELVTRLLDAQELHVGQADVVHAALQATAGGMDFADAVVAELGASAGCDYTLTFDRRAARADTMRLLGQ